MHSEVLGRQYCRRSFITKPLLRGIKEDAWSSLTTLQWLTLLATSAFSNSPLLPLVMVRHIHLLWPGLLHPWLWLPSSACPRDGCSTGFCPWPSSLDILTLRNLILPHVTLTGPSVWTVPKALAPVPASTSSFRLTLPFFYRTFLSTCFPGPKLNLPLSQTCSLSQVPCSHYWWRIVTLT